MTKCYTIIMDNNFKEIKFYDGIGYQVTNSTIVNNIVGRLVKYYKLEIDRAFSKYFKFADSEDIAALKKDRHLAYYNFSAQHTLLFLTNYNGINFCYYLDPKKMQLVSVKHRFCDSLYQNDTLFEGKFVKGTDGWHFLISDLVIHEKHTYTADLTKKLQTINSILTRQFISDPVLDPVQISLQDFVDYQYLQSFTTQYKDTLPYREEITGIVFRCVISSNTRNIIILFKPGFHSNLRLPELGPTKATLEKLDPSKMGESHRNLCFKLKKTKTPDIYELFLTDGKNDCFYDYAGIPDIKTSRSVKSMFPDNKYHYIIATCKWDPKFLRWEPYRRSTRKTPDSIYVFIKPTNSCQ